MKKRRKNLLICFVILLFIVTMLLNPALCKKSITASMECFYKQVFPSLFPMFVFSKLLIDFEFPSLLNRIFGRFLQKIFHVSKGASFLFFMSLFAGCPSNAFLAKELVSKGDLSKSDASIVLSYTLFSNPLFLLTILPTIFPFQDAIFILLILYFANFIVGILLRPKHFSSNFIQEERAKYNSLSSSLGGSISKALETLLLILGTIVFFFLIHDILNEIFSFSPLTSSLVSGILEVTQGLKSLSSLAYPLFLKKILALFFLSCGGLSIHLQIKSILEDTSISFLPFLKGRFLQFLIATICSVITQICF